MLGIIHTSIWKSENRNEIQKKYFVAYVFLETCKEFELLIV